MAYTMRRLLKPLLVLAALISWESWHAQQVRSANSAAKLPIEIPLQTDGGMPSIELMVNGQGPFLFGIEFPEAAITFPALGDIGNGGGRILSQFALTFDQQHERVRLTRPGPDKGK